MEWTGRRNYELNSSIILKYVYRLLSLVLADDAIAVAAANENDQLAELRSLFIEEEIVHLLFGTAIANRAHDDHMQGPRQDPNELSFAPVDRSCGEWVRDVQRPDAQCLTLREACNKIIHAENIRIETIARNGRAFEVINPVVYLEGRRGRTQWSATLDLVQYAQATFENFGDLG
ncbi:hypothetical protein GR183_17505 [Stappia sp. GBMRC 2046]|uniref:Uncharacterized protein n=1 Tax=Stappia sediminis TaxID=2692190 RepID=A0A7X3LX29_9HYPH|nr:hypothetical protein [Stappia sediminis]MXN66714.1 hypothetical protein [Stappia sediminis]